MKEALGISERLSPFVQSIGITQSVFGVTPRADDGLIESTFGGVLRAEEILPHPWARRAGRVAAYSLPVIPRGVSSR